MSKIELTFKPADATIVLDVSGGTVTIGGLGALPQSSVEYAIVYGLKQSLADSYVSGETVGERAGLLEKRLEKLMSGEMSASGNMGGNRRDPVTVRAQQMLHQRLIASGKKSKDAMALVAAVWSADVTEKQIAAREKLIETARVQLANESELDVEV